MNPVSEQIDERILRLLGLEDVFDLDYDTYMTLLREAMVKGANRLPQEELALLANERKRIRGREGRFNPAPQKITVDNFGGIGNIISKKLTLPGAGILALSQKTAELRQKAVEVPQEQQVVQQTIPQDQFVELNQTLSSILDTVNKLYDLEVRKAGEAALLAEKKSRRVREDTSESAAGLSQKASEAFQTVVAPFQNILDKIFGFVKFIFLGKVFLQLVDWASDPKNLEKIQSLGRFIKDFWPLLLTGYILPFKGFIAKSIAKLAFYSGRLVLTNPGVQLGLMTLYDELRRQRERERLIQQEANKTGKSAEEVRKGKEKSEAGFLSILGRGLRDASLFSSGGEVTGPKGIDKVPAMLTEGEVVINKKTVDAIGAEVFLALNRLYGGPDANKPKMMRFQTGGLVGKKDSLLNQKALQIYNRLISGGLTSTAAMGVVSNIGVETGYTYDPSTVQKKNGPGRGLVQWEKGGRYDTDSINLMSFAESRKKPWNDLNTQVDFILYELNNHPEYMEVKNMINTAKTVEQATEVFLTRYEKAGVSHLDRRYAVAEELQNKIRAPKEQTTSVKPKPTLKPYGPGGDPKGTGLGQEQQRSIVIPKQEKKPERWAIDPRGWFGLKDGAIVNGENTNRIVVPPNASDTQVAALEIGEAVLPKPTVDLLGENLIKQIIDKTNLGNPDKQIIKSDVNRYTPTPLNRSGMSGMMTLPPQVMSSGDQMLSSASGSLVPFFSVQAASSQDTRKNKSDIYGIA